MYIVKSVCMCSCKYAYIHSSLRTLHTYIHVCIVTINVRTKILMYITYVRCMDMYVCMYVCMYRYVCMYVCMHVYMYVCMYMLGISWSTRSVERRAAGGVLPARQGDDEVDQHEILSQNIRKRQSEAQHFDCLPP